MKMPCIVKHLSPHDHQHGTLEAQAGRLASGTSSSILLTSSDNCPTHIIQ